MKALKAFRQLVCPEDVSCMLCAAETEMGNGTGLCGKCLRTLDKYEGQREIEGFILYAAYVYEGAVASLIHGLKYENKRYMALPLIKGLIGTCNDKGLFPDVVIPVPLHKKRQRQRGFNQSALLAEGVCEYFDIPLWRNALIRTRDTKQQVGLNETERWENVRDAFICKADVYDKHVVVLDDVCTTGATMLSCARTLKEKGARITLICAATLHTGNG